MWVVLKSGIAGVVTLKSQAAVLGLIKILKFAYPYQ